jgi:hypothetical protein
MGYLKQKVELYKQQGTEFSSSADLSTVDAFDIKIDHSTQDAKDSFEFKILNSNNKFFDSQRIFEVGDRIKIYIWRNAQTETDPTDLVMDGLITEPPMKISSNGRMLTIKGFSRTDLMFASLVFLNRQDLTLPQIIKLIIDEVNSDNLLQAGSAKKINYVYNGVDQDGNATTDDDTISDTNSSSVTFTEIIQVREIYRKAIELIKKYSSPEYTNDGNYVYYLDPENKFHWGPRNTTVTSTQMTEGDDIEDIEIKISKEDIITAVVVNVGMSPSNRGNTAVAINPSGVTKHGARWKFISKLQNLSESIMTFEEQNNQASFDINKDRFPTSYPYTTHFKSSADFPTNPVLNLPSATAGSTITVDSDDEYDAVIRREAEYIGEQFGNALLEVYANPKFEVTASQPFNKNFGLSNFIPHTISSYNFDEKNLRLGRRVFSVMSTDYVSTEDVEEAGS